MKNDLKNMSKNETTGNAVSLLLDSSLISQYERSFQPLKMYDLKVVKCGSYVQIYIVQDITSKHNTLYEKDVLKNIDTDCLSFISKENKKVSKLNDLKQISLSNAIRSKFGCQRLAKTNMSKWESFITLTFKDNVKDISIANKEFSNWVSNIRKIKKDFMYISVPEFQSRGAVHYHILSNIGINDTKILYQQVVKVKKAVYCNQLYDVKYWNKGFARVDFIKGNVKKIVGYISKYMTEDIDNRLFSKHRYMYSQNLEKISTSYVDLNDNFNFTWLNELLKDKTIIYSNIYKDTYTNTDIKFVEYLENGQVNIIYII